MSEIYKEPLFLYLVVSGQHPMAGTGNPQWAFGYGEKVDENWHILDSVRTCYPNATSLDVFKAFEILNGYDEKFRADYLTNEFGKRRAALIDKQNKEFKALDEEERAAKKRKHEELEGVIKQ